MQRHDIFFPLRRRPSGQHHSPPLRCLPDRPPPSPSVPPKDKPAPGDRTHGDRAIRSPIDHQRHRVDVPDGIQRRKRDRRPAGVRPADLERPDDSRIEPIGHQGLPIDLNVQPVKDDGAVHRPAIPIHASPRNRPDEKSSLLVGLHVRSWMVQNSDGNVFDADRIASVLRVICFLTSQEGDGTEKQCSSGSHGGLWWMNWKTTYGKRRGFPTGTVASAMRLWYLDEINHHTADREDAQHCHGSGAHGGSIPP